MKGARHHGNSSDHLTVVMMMMMAAAVYVIDTVLDFNCSRWADDSRSRGGDARRDEGMDDIYI